MSKVGYYSVALGQYEVLVNSINYFQEIRRKKICMFLLICFSKIFSIQK